MIKVIVISIVIVIIIIIIIVVDIGKYLNRFHSYVTANFPLHPLQQTMLIINIQEIKLKTTLTVVSLSAVVNCFIIYVLIKK